MSDPIDFESIQGGGLRSGRALVQQLIPGGTFRSLERIVRNPRREDKHHGSFKINYRTEQWTDFAIDDKSARGGAAKADGTPSFCFGRGQEKAVSMARPDMGLTRKMHPGRRPAQP
jgi:hypothetical protein